MKFQINSKQLHKMLTPAVEIAPAKARKYRGLRRPPQDSDACAISFRATHEALTVNTRGYAVSFVTRLTKSDGYICQEEGSGSVWPDELATILEQLSDYDDDLLITMDRQHLKIAFHDSEGDVACIQAVPDTYFLPELPSKHYQQITVDREYFVKGLNKVKWAQSKEEKMFCYMCILFESDIHKLRFSAGTGGRFAVTDYESGTKQLASSAIKVIFPKSNHAYILKILKHTTCSTINITTYKSEGDIPEQITVEADITAPETVY